MGEKSGSRSGMNNPDHISESLKNNSLMRIRDPGWKKFGSRIRDGGIKNVRMAGSGIREKHPGSATLLGRVEW
jgi:hypothetical protein